MFSTVQGQSEMPSEVSGAISPSCRSKAVWQHQAHNSEIIADFVNVQFVFLTNKQHEMDLTDNQNNHIPQLSKTCLYVHFPLQDGDSVS